MFTSHHIQQGIIPHNVTFTVVLFIDAIVLLLYRHHIATCGASVDDDISLIVDMNTTIITVSFRHWEVSIHITVIVAAVIVTVDVTILLSFHLCYGVSLCVASTTKTIMLIVGIASRCYKTLVLD